VKKLPFLLSSKKIEIKGKRVFLRALKLSDTARLCFLLNDKEIFENTSFQPPVTFEKEKKFILDSQKKLKKGEEIVWGIDLKKEKTLVGCISLKKIDWIDRKAEVGYWLGKDWRGRGLMTEALGLVLNFSFEKLKLHRIFAFVFSDNIASQRVLEKMGFKKEGELREHKYRFGKWKDAIVFGILEKEFNKK